MDLFFAKIIFIMSLLNLGFLLIIGILNTIKKNHKKEVINIDQQEISLFSSNKYLLQPKENRNLFLRRLALNFKILSIMNFNFFPNIANSNKLITAYFSFIGNNDTNQNIINDFNKIGYLQYSKIYE